MPGLVHENDRAENHFAFRQKFRNRLRLVKTLSQIQSLLTLGRNDVNRVIAVFNPLPISRVVWLLPRVRAATKERHEISRTQNFSAALR